MRQYRLVDRRWFGNGEAEDCITLDEVPEDELLFVNDTGYFYSGKTLLDYFKSETVRLDPIQRVPYLNPFEVEFPPYYDELDITETLFLNWAPEITPLTFTAEDLLVRPSWHGFIKSKLICFLARVRKKGAAVPLPWMKDYRMKMLYRLCRVLGWYDLSVEIDQIIVTKKNTSSTLVRWFLSMGKKTGK